MAEQAPQSVMSEQAPAQSVMADPAPAIAGGAPDGAATAIDRCCCIAACCNLIPCIIDCVGCMGRILE